MIDVGVRVFIFAQPEKGQPCLLQIMQTIT
jgi:hypothetical protein